MLIPGVLLSVLLSYFNSMMEISAASIQRFFDRTATAEEAEAVAAYFYSDVQLLEEYFTDEWTEHASAPLSTEESQEMFAQIRQKTERRVLPVKWIKRSVAIAAAVLLSVSMIWLYRQHTKGAAEIQLDTPAVAKWMVKRNSSNKVLAIWLEDGSEVQMAPGAQLRYRSFAQVKTRDLELTGEALFKVVKDETKPFTVTTGDIATTVLGTTFAIAENQEKITVRLLEGKVVVRPLSQLGDWTSPVVLNPGESLVFHRQTRSMNWLRKGASGKQPATDKAENDTIDASLFKTNATWYMFNNESLVNVFGQLEEMYNVHIRYDAADLKDVYYIGRFDKTDSIEAILNNIALLKKLKIQHKENTYIITKKVH